MLLKVQFNRVYTQYSCTIHCAKIALQLEGNVPVASKLFSYIPHTVQFQAHPHRTTTST
jgi:hypothetical protein